MKKPTPQPKEHPQKVAQDRVYNQILDNRAFVGWIKEFDNAFDHWVLNYLMADDAFDMDLRESVARSELKEVIRKVEAQAYAKGRADAYQVPMGCSEWMNHGKKYFYWEFFEKEAREKAFEDCMEVLGKRYSEVVGTELDDDANGLASGIAILKQQLKKQ